MMKFVALTTEPFGVKTIVSLNTIMVDGTGMCGGCRVQLKEGARFVCVDGPEFDAHLVDWNLLLARQQFYQAEERLAVERWERLRQLETVA
jgi:ferredoxin--NADP+ reductase